MSAVYSYSFHNTDRIGSDFADDSRQNLDNDKYSKYILSNFANDNAINTQVNFASKLPTMVTTGLTSGRGLGGNVIDAESKLKLETEQQHSYAKLELMQRPFLTVPYLGRGSCDPTLELKLKKGELTADVKSITTIMDKPYIDFDAYPLLDNVKSHIHNASTSLDDVSKDGWTWGGVPTRELLHDKEFSNNYRPNNKL